MTAGCPGNICGSLHRGEIRSQGDVDCGAFYETFDQDQSGCGKGVTDCHVTPDEILGLC